MFVRYETPENMRNIYFLPILLLFICSCMAPRVVTEIVPEAPQGHFANGREYIPLEGDDFEVELGYDGQVDEYLVFDLVVHNTTTDTISIRPGSFYYVVLDSANAEASPYTPWMSVHPDRVVMLYDQTLAERNKDKEMNTFLGILQAGVDILYSASGYIATEDPGFIVDAVLNTVGTADHYIKQDRMISSDRELINQEKAIVEEEIFRTSRLAPGETASGYVYFPGHDQTSYYMFCFPLENQLFQFVYNQRQVIVYD